MRGLMPNKSLAIGLVLGLIIGLPMGYLLYNQLQTQSQFSNTSETQNPEIFCSTEESGTSSWGMTGGCPVLSSYDFGAKNFSSLPNVNLGVRVWNNNSISLFNVEVEVTYRTVENNWNTTEKVNIGFLDIQQSKKTKITLISPYLLLWDTRRPEYTREGTVWENVTVYVINASDCKITAYGFPKP